MFSTLFSKTPMLEQGTREWIFDTFAWAIENLELQVFKQDSQLILPSNQFYPGRVSSVDEMAQSIFDHTVKYAGMENWPLRLVNQQSMTANALPDLTISQAIRGKNAQICCRGEQSTAIDIGYNPIQVNQPQDLISSIVQSLATILVMSCKTLPPGGKEFVPQAIDLVACFMGFGIIFSNTAYQFKGGCGSCNNPNANREVALPENETVYCLAVFSLLKSIPTKSVLPHLKSHLKSVYKKSYKELDLYIKQSQNPTLMLAMK